MVWQEHYAEGQGEKEKLSFSRRWLLHWLLADPALITADPALSGRLDQRPAKVPLNLNVSMILWKWLWNCSISFKCLGVCFFPAAMSKVAGGGNFLFGSQQVKNMDSARRIYFLEKAAILHMWTGFMCATSLPSLQLSGIWGIHRHRS